MFIDARQLTDGSRIEADIAIVGAGAAGITLALEMSDHGLRVCLLESGGFEYSWPTQSLYTAANIGLPYYALDFCQLRFLGGSTNAWGGWCRPFDPIDFEPRNWVDYSGWPFRIDELIPYYRRAHKICQVSSDDYDLDRALAELNHPRAKPIPFNSKWLETTIYRFSAPTRFGTVYRRALERAQQLHCYLNANVLAVRTDANARTVTRLDLGTLTGVRSSVHARHFVLSAGGIENARILLLSSDVVESGLGNQHDLVGRFFMEHPHVKRRVIIPSQRLESAIYGERFHHRAIMARMAIPEAVQRRERLLGYGANLHAVHLGHESAGWLALRKMILSLSGSRHTDPFIRFPPYGKRGLTVRQFMDLIVDLPRVSVAGVLRLLQPNRFISGFLLESKPEQAPNRDSRVSLDGALDAFGLRRVKLDWRTLPIDRQTTLRGEEIIDAELRRLEIGSVAPLKPSEIEEWPDTLEGGWHQLGTTRMHVDPKQGVVDANASVHGMANLSIAGGSVFPTGGSGPPTLTIVALTLRLADRLRREIVGH